MIAHPMSNTARITSLNSIKSNLSTLYNKKDSVKSKLNYCTVNCNSITNIYQHLRLLHYCDIYSWLLLLCIVPNLAG